MALKVRAVVRLLKFDQDKEWLMKLKKITEGVKNTLL